MEMINIIILRLHEAFASLKHHMAPQKLSPSNQKADMPQVSIAAAQLEAPGVTLRNTEVRSARGIPETQSVLLLHGKGQPYQVHEGGELPQLAFGDLLVEIHAIGLNPIDWKSAYVKLGRRLLQRYLG